MKERPILFSSEMIRAILDGSVPDAFRQWNESRRVVLDDGEVAHLFDEGRTAKEMAAIFGCSSSPVKRSMRRLGLRRPAKQRQGAQRQREAGVAMTPEARALLVDAGAGR